MISYNRPVPVLFWALTVRPFPSLPGPVNKICQEENRKYGDGAVKTHSISNDKPQSTYIYRVPREKAS